MFVFLSGGLGSALRYSIQRFAGSSQFPYATLSVNIAGCFLAGLFFSFITKHQSTEHIKAVLLAGFCGGFTTFSAFSLESTQLYKENPVQFLAYVALSLVVCLAATFLGMRLIK